MPVSIPFPVVASLLGNPTVTKLAFAAHRQGEADKIEAKEEQRYQNQLQFQNRRFALNRQIAEKRQSAHLDAVAFQERQAVRETARHKDRLLFASKELQVSERLGRMQAHAAREAGKYSLEAARIQARATKSASAIGLIGTVASLFF